MGSGHTAIQPSGGGESLVAVSCASATSCTAVGSTDFAEGGGGVPIYATESSGEWSSTELLNGSNDPLLSVDCTSATDCTAAGWSGIRVEAAGVWRDPIALPITPAGVSCVSATACTAVGDLGAVKEFAGTWGAATGFSTPDGSGGGFNSVSCSSANNCTAV